MTFDDISTLATQVRPQLAVPSVLAKVVAPNGAANNGSDSVPNGSDGTSEIAKRLANIGHERGARDTSPNEVSPDALTKPSVATQAEYDNEANVEARNSEAPPEAIVQAALAPTSPSVPAPIRNLISQPTQAPAKAEQPEKPSQPNRSLGQKLVHGLEVALPYIGAVGGGMEAAGSPNHEATSAKLLLQAEEAAAERALKSKELEEVEKPKAEAYADYFSGRNETAQNVANTRALAQVTAQQMKSRVGLLQDQVKALGSGLVPVFDSNGQQTGYRPATKEEFSQMPLLAAHANRLQAQSDLADAQARYFNAKPGLEQQKIQAEMALLQKRLQQADANLAIRQREFGINNYGIDPATGQAPPGVALMDNGEGGQTPVGKKFQTNVLPTAQMRNMGEMAGTVMVHVNPLREMIQQNAEDLGPFMGRLSHVLSNGFGSTGDPDRDRRLANLFGTMKLMQSAVARTHFGGRTGPQAVQYFNKQLDSAKSPEALQGVIDSYEPFMGTYNETGVPKVSGGTPAGATAKTKPNGKKKDSLGIL